MSSLSGSTALDSVYGTSGSTTSISNSNSELDKEAFLMLLVTQFQYQDPLNPMEDKEFIAQLAQFSALEQSMAMNENITNLMNLTAMQTSIHITNYIGKEVSARGYGIYKEGDEVSLIQYAGSEEMSSCVINILDASNNIVRTVDLGSQASGIHDFVWDGKKSDGSEAPDGTYTVSFTGKNANGDAVYIDTSVSGRVTGTSSYNGEYYLSLTGGRVVLLSNVREVLESTASSATPGKEYIGTERNDYLEGEAGAADTISAGDGNDIILYDEFDELIDGGDGFDFLLAEGDLQNNYKNIEAVIRGSDAKSIQSYNALTNLGITITDGKLDMTAAGWTANWESAGNNQWTYTGDKKLTIEILDTSKIIEAAEESAVQAQLANAASAANSVLSAAPAQSTFSQALADGLRNSVPTSTASATAQTLKEKASSAINSYMKGIIAQ